MNTNSFNDAVRQFITHQFSQARTRALADDDPLLEGGIVDSLGVLDLVRFIESEFGVSVEDEELTPEHFNSIGRIGAYIQNKQKEAGMPASR
jgi:acyl carrier protein